MKLQTKLSWLLLWLTVYIERGIYCTRGWEKGRCTLHMYDSCATRIKLSMSPY